MSLTREVLTPVTTAAGLYPALHTLISQVAMPNMVTRQIYQQYSLTASNSVTFPKQAGDAGAVINEIGEGAEILLDVTPYSYVNVVPKKFGQGFIISRETIEDSMLPVQTDNLVRISLRTANKVDQDCIDTAITGVQSGNVFTGSGTSLFFQGAETVVSGSGSIGQYDIIDSITKIERFNYVPDTLIIHPNSKAFVTRLPHFTTTIHYGEPIMQEGQLQAPGLFGEILGLDAFSSVNIPGFTRSYTGTYAAAQPRALIASRGRTSNILGQYSPLGFFVERRPLTTAVKPLEERDSIGIYVTIRYAPVVVQGKTISVLHTLTS